MAAWCTKHAERANAPAPARNAIYSPAKATPFAGGLEPSWWIGLLKGSQTLSAN
jgi:hypothetical protein